MKLYRTSRIPLSPAEHAVLRGEAAPQPQTATDYDLTDGSDLLIEIDNTTPPTDVTPANGKIALGGCMTVETGDYL
jgi:hypothetical protein